MGNTNACRGRILNVNRPFFIFILIALCSVFFLPCGDCYSSHAHGLWVECEGSNETLSSPGKLDEMIRISKDTEVNDIFLQVYRHNRSWYNSELADNVPFRKIFDQYNIDPLSYTITKAHRKGISVHAWINIYRIGRDLNVPIVKKLGRDIITCDGKGRSMAEYSVSNLPDGGYWLDPGDPAVRDYLLEIVQELLKKYPQLDGIHLDFIRFPYKDLNPGSKWAQRKDFGYGKQSIQRFKTKYGYSPLQMDLNDRMRTQEWDDWRRTQITDFVADVYELCKKRNKDIKVSAAVQPWPDRAYMVAHQDWRAWLEKKIIDFIALMNYGTDPKMVKYLSQTAVNFSHDPAVYVGLGAYLMLKTPQMLYDQIKDCQELSAGGIVLFSYDAILKNSSIFKTIAKNKWWETRPKTKD